MAKTRAPLLSFGAAGQIGKTQVYASWRGVPYARQLVKPANPKTAGQTLTRNVFADLTQLWKLAPAIAQEPWTANASGRPYTNRNKLLSVNIPLLRSADDWSAFVGSPGAKGGPTAGAFTVAAAGSTVTGTVTEPALPTGWTIIEAVMWLVPNGDPQSDTNFVSYAASDEATPFAPAIDDVPDGDYLATAWFKYQATSTVVAYGPSLSATVTVGS